MGSGVRRVRLGWYVSGLVATVALVHLVTVSAPGRSPHTSRGARAAAPRIQPSAASRTGTRVRLEPDPVRGMGRRFRNGMMVRGGTPHRLILFTFDDGPNERSTSELLDSLDRFDVRAVFFLTASRLSGETRRGRNHQELAREILRRGHLIGNHTLEHRVLTGVHGEALRREVVEAERLLEQVLGERPWLFRPPGGARSPRVDAFLASRGYTTVMWNLGTGDVQVRSPERSFHTWKRVLQRRFREEGTRGGIVLLHDLHPWSVRAFELIMREIRRRNCVLLDRGEELYDVVDDLSFFYFPRADGDPSHWAPQVRLDVGTLEARQAWLRKRASARCRS